MEVTDNTVLTTESDDWDDITLDEADISDDSEPDEPDIPDTPPSDEQEETPGSDGESESSDGPDSGEETPPEAETFELKHLDDRAIRVGRDEVVSLAQKGLDYDRVREKLSAHEALEQEFEALKSEREKDKEYLEFLGEMAAARGVDLPELMDGSRAAMIAEAEGIDVKTATERVKLERERRALDAERSRITAQEQTKDAGRAELERRAQELAGFAKAYPDADVNNLPNEVWKSVADGMPLVAAYAMHENARLKLEIQAKEKSAKNQSRAAGSRTTSGQSALDDIDKYWYEDDD